MDSSQSSAVFEITDEMVERAAAALLGEMGAGELKPDPRQATYTKDALRLAVRKILWAASDPLWGKR